MSRKRYRKLRKEFCSYTVYTQEKTDLKNTDRILLRHQKHTSFESLEQLVSPSRLKALVWKHIFFQKAWLLPAATAETKTLPVFVLASPTS